MEKNYMKLATCFVHRSGLMMLLNYVRNSTWQMRRVRSTTVLPNFTYKWEGLRLLLRSVL